MLGSDSKMCSSSVVRRANMDAALRREIIFDERCAAFGYFKTIEETQAMVMVDSPQLALEGPTPYTVVLHEYLLQYWYWCYRTSLFDDSCIGCRPRKRMEFDYYPITDEIYAKFSIINSGDYPCAVNVSCQQEKGYTVKFGNAIVLAGKAHEIHIFMDERMCCGRKVENDYFTVNLVSISAEHFDSASFVDSYDRRILFASISQAAKDRLDIVARQKSWLPWKWRYGRRRCIELVLGAVLVGLVLLFLSIDFCDCFARE